MAGTLHYRLRVDHIYQRRFGEQAELTQALKASHWYIVTRRPAVRIIEDSARLDDRILTIDLATSPSLTQPRAVRTLGGNFAWSDSLSNFRTYAGGAYFSVEINGQIAHGDAWALACLLSDTDIDLSSQEVLYIGQAFGTAGSRNAAGRLAKHEKLQKIYEDHADIDCDIFVAPLSLERHMFISDDHIDDDDDGPSMTLYEKRFTDPAGGVSKTAVDLIEHSLISYFVPYYNDKLRTWRHEEPISTMRAMRDAGFRLLQIHLSGWWSLGRFCSDAIPEKFRSHLISHDLPPEPRRPALRGIAAERLSEWRHPALMVREGQDLLEDQAARTGVAIRIFGDKAPTLRRPPGVTLPALPSISADTQREHDQIRAEILDQRESMRRATAPIPLSHYAEFYDPSTGEITVGQRTGGGPSSVRLHSPETGKSLSTLIFGDPDRGRTNTLTTMLVQAIRTGLFYPAIADVQSTGALRPLAQPPQDQLYAEGPEACYRLLEACERIIEARSATGEYSGPSRKMPGILLGIDDADELLAHRDAARSFMRILSEGGPTGVGVALVIGDILTFEHNPRLMRHLACMNARMMFTQQGPSLMRYVDAKYRNQRTESWAEDDALTFVIHHDPSDTVLSIAANSFDAHISADHAQRLVEEDLRQYNKTLVVEWQQNDDPESWWSMDNQTQRWQLCHHDDSWLLLAVQTNQPHVERPDIIDWANRCIEKRFELQLGQWSIGPGTGAPGTEVFYADTITSNISVKDRSESLMRLLSEFY